MTKELPIDIIIPVPAWNSNIPSIILQLEGLRHHNLIGTTPMSIFIQLKDIFQLMETLASARIEGNNTTISEAIELHLTPPNNPTEKWNEIHNLQLAMQYIEQTHQPHLPITKSFIFQLHQLVTQNLHNEGSKFMGQLRKTNVKIAKSWHVPPDYIVLNDYFDKFIEFINQPVTPQNNLLKLAVAHHRFMYIHPFDNGNGRVGRLLNYALLLKMGYERQGSLNIFNPSALFFASREKYYEKLSQADTLENDNILQWCEYFLGGLNHEMTKITNFLNRNHINTLLNDIMHDSMQKNYINNEEYDFLLYVIKEKPNMEVKSSELDEFGFKKSAEKSYFIKKLRDKKILTPTTPNGRIYQLDLFNSILLRSAIQILRQYNIIDPSLDS